MIAYLEKTFASKVDDQEMIPDILDSIAKIVAFVGRKQG